MITFPLYPMARDAEGVAYCTCTKPNCKGEGKHPRVLDWTSLTESVPLDDSEGWGFLTGGDLWVFDVDVKNGGLESFKRLIASHPEEPWPVTYRVRTGGGGFHDYFRRPEGFTVHSSLSRIAEGIDILGAGKYAVGEGSPHKLGGKHTMEVDAPIADAPRWLLAWIAANPGTTGKKLEASSWNPVTPEDPTYQDRVKEQIDYFQRAPVFKSGGGKHRYVIMLQNAGPGLLLDDTTTVENFRKHYDPRLPAEDRWFPDHEEEFRGEIIRRAWACTMEKGHKPDGLWGQRAFFLGQKQVIEKASARGAAEFGTAVPSGNGKKKTPADAAFFLSSHDDWRGVLSYDEFREQLVAKNPPMRLDAETSGLSEEDITAIQGWFEFREYIVAWDTVAKIVRLIAKQNRFHPVKEYLASLPVRGPDVFEGLSSRLFGSPKDLQEHDDTILQKFFTAAYARIVRPGVKHDNILVLHGPQGYMKSTFVKEMFEPWYRDQMPDLANRDGSMALEGYWGIELAELDKMQRLETSTVKDFLSRSVDQYRGFGTKDKVERPRQCVFIGTTNEDEFLRDITGNRRFWIIHVHSRIPRVTDALRRDIWSAARSCYEYGENHWLDEQEEKAAEEVRKGFEIADPWQHKVDETVKKMGISEIKTAEVLEKLFTSGLPDLKSINDHGLKRVARCLKALGWTAKRKPDGGVRYWVKELPEAKSNVIPFSGGTPRNP